MRRAASAVSVPSSRGAAWPATSALLATAALALVACNDLFGLEPVELRVGDGSGAGGSGASIDPGGGGSGGSGASIDPGGGGAGGEPLHLFQCGEVGFDSGLILYGNLNDSDDWGGADVAEGNSAVGEVCEGTYYLTLSSSQDGPPGTGYIDSDGEPGPLVENPCLRWRIAARDPLGQTPRFWLLFNFGELEEEKDVVVNLLTPLAGTDVTTVGWSFYDGVCEVTVPAQVDNLADVRIYVQGSVYFDAFEAHAVACEPEIPPCGSL